MKSRLLFFISLCSILNLFGQEKYFFSQLSLEDELSQISITSIHQGSNNLMWFGTRNGLNKYNGYDFEVFIYSPTDTTSISNNHILSIAEDGDGYLWIGTNYGLNKYSAKSNTFYRYFANSNDSLSIPNNIITALYTDSKKNLWIGTSSGISLYNSQNNNFITYTFGNLLLDNAINVIEEYDGVLYIGTMKKGLFICTVHSDRLNIINHLTLEKNEITSNDIRAIYKNGEGEVWLGTHHDGICLLNKDFKSYSVYNQNNGLSNDYVRSITETPEGAVLIGTFNGLNVVDKVGTIAQYQSSNRKEGALSHYSVYTTFFDKNKTLWVGTYAGGINYYNPLGQKFHFYNPANSQDKMLGIIGPMIETQEYLYIASEGGGLLEMNKRTNDFKQYLIFEDKQDTHARNILKSLYLDGNKILCGTNLGTIYSFNLQSRRFDIYHDFREINSIYQIEKSKNGELLIAGVNQIGLTIRGKDGAYNNTFRLQDGSLFSFFNTRCVLELSENVFLVGTRNKGLIYFDREKGIVKNYSNIIPENYISSIFKDSNKNIWVGTFGGGLSLLDIERETAQTFNTNNGLFDANICSIVEDDNQKLWISTSTSISQLDIATLQIKNYLHSNGIAVNEFTPHAGCKLSNSEIVFSGNNGFITFHPRKISVNPYIPHVLLDKLYVNNALVVPHANGSILQGQLYTQKAIVLKYNESNIGIEYSALNYILSGKNEYKYMLEGFDDEWNEVGSRRIAYYTNIPSGNYIFKVRGSNNDGVWNQEEATLHIKVLPPYWRTWWAYMLYTILFISILYFTSKNYNERRKLKNNIKLEHARAEVQKEFHEARNRLFSNFSHELRMPLTLIMSPLGNMIEEEKDFSEKVKKHHRLMYNNTLRMLRLVNNLMSFQKNESGALNPQFSENDFISFSEEMVAIFKDMAGSRNINFQQDISVTDLLCHFDPNLIEKVFINILSNAFKNTEDGGEVMLRINTQTLDEIRKIYPQKAALLNDSHYVFIQFTDSGEGIPTEDLENIFKPFYQVAQNQHSSSGTGLGLSLSKSIVELHRGVLWAENNQSKGATIYCLIPTQQAVTSEITHTERKHDTALRKIELLNNTDEKEQTDVYQHTIMVVEDNPNVRNYIASLFSERCNILLAPNGKIAIEKAKEYMPDIIVTDLMMPEMDGMQMCECIKNDIHTSHIPIIMITAKAMTEDILEGYKVGADGYITKPFEASILVSRVTSLLKHREALKAHYGKQFKLLEHHATEASSLDEQFIQKLYKFLDENISNVELNLDDFCRDLGMSRSSFYRKIKSMTNLSPSEFVRNFRLEMGAKLLAQASLTVSDVYVAVGFNSMAYFSTCFKAYFGQTPTEYIQRADNGKF